MSKSITWYVRWSNGSEMTGQTLASAMRVVVAAKPVGCVLDLKHGTPRIVCDMVDGSVVEIFEVAGTHYEI